MSELMYRSYGNVCNTVLKYGGMADFVDLASFSYGRAVSIAMLLQSILCIDKDENSFILSWLGSLISNSDYLGYF